MIKYDYSKLKGRLREKGKTQGWLAKQAGINPSTLNSTLCNKRCFRQDEMELIYKALELPNYEDYFFATVVTKA